MSRACYNQVPQAEYSQAMSKCYGSVQLDNGAIWMYQTRLALGGAKAWRKGRRSRRHAVALGNIRPVNWPSTRH